MRTRGVLVLVALSAVGCTALLPATDPLRDGGSDLPDTNAPDAGAGEDADIDGGSPSGCGPLADRPIILHGESGEEVISTSTTWDCRSVHVLADNVFVTSGARLTVQAGTEVRGTSDHFLMISRGSSLSAIGTRDLPIVFTSNAPVGSRAPRDWRGLVLLGDGPTHSVDETVDLTTSIDDLRGQFGGGPTAAPAGTCGELSYVRVEFAGGRGNPTDSPSSALTFAACGRDTSIDHIQVHRGSDGLGLIGGQPFLRNVVVSSSAGDGIEWSGGFGGSLQYVIVQHRAGGGTGLAIKGSNSEGDPTALPVSRPELFNATLVGSGALLSGQEIGIGFLFGSQGELRNSIIVGFPSYAIDVRTAESAAGFAAGSLRASGSLFWANGEGLDGDLPGGGVEMDDDSNDDSSFSELTSFMMASENNRFLREITFVGDATDISCPPGGTTDDPCPVFGSNLAVVSDGTYGTARDARIDSSARYSGALPRIQVGSPPDWTLGWTAFPAN